MSAAVYLVVLSGVGLLASNSAKSPDLGDLSVADSCTMAAVVVGASFVAVSHFCQTPPAAAERIAAADKRPTERL